ncbi:mobilization protein, partial [Yersinia rochesterensis]|uniref:mobilization protein n=1 Tax=Yersinia rochesterensis TaxID=1604335 RepID=UPI001FD59423
SAKRISAAMLDHDRTLSSAMSQRTKGMVRMVSQTWLTIVLVSVLLTASGAGILWWQGQQILDNYMSIREQQDALEKLNVKTWGVSFQSDSNGQFLVLPKGVKAETSWTVENGKRNAVKLVRE